MYRVHMGVVCVFADSTDQREQNPRLQEAPQMLEVRVADAEERHAQRGSHSQERPGEGCQRDGSDDGNAKEYGPRVSHERALGSESGHRTINSALHSSRDG